MKDSGFIKDCQCTIAVGTLIYTGVIVDIDKYKLKFIRQVPSGPITKLELVYIFNPSERISSVHYDYDEIKVRKTNIKQVELKREELVDPSEKEEVRKKYSEAIRTNDKEKLIEVNKQERQNLLSVIKKSFNDVPKIGHERDNPFIG
jgi:phage protein D